MDCSYDRVLSQVGNEGKYQKRFDIIYNVISASLWAMAYYNIILALTVIPHTCKIPERPAHISASDWKFKYIPIVTDVAGTEKYSDCLIYTNEDNKTAACNYYDYDTTWYESTVPSENNWVCDKEIYVAHIFAYSKVGEIIGSMFFGWFGDIYGRKLTYIISLALLIIGRLISIIASSSFTLFAIGFVIASFPSWSAPQSASIISIEISSPRRRSTVAKLRLVATSFGLFLMPFLYWWLRNWKSFLIITTLAQLPCLLICWKLIESPQWLWINGKNKAVLRNLKRIAKTNKTELTPDIETEIMTSAVKSSNTEILGPIALFSGWQIALNTILQLFIWICISVNYTIAVMSSGEKTDGNPFLDFAWQSLAEIPGYFIGAWLADRVGRRFTGIVSFSITCLIWTIGGYREVSGMPLVFMKFLQPRVPFTHGSRIKKIKFNDVVMRLISPGNATWIKTEWLSMTLDVINRCSMTVSYYIINLLNMELYPTCLRQSGMSLGNVVSGGASALAPYILYLGRRIDARYPSIILTVTTLFGGILSICLLPETRNAKLPETLEDAHSFGRLHRIHRQVNAKSEEISLNSC